MTHHKYPEEVERYRDARGYLAEDPGSGRWHWSVRWPAHECHNASCIVKPGPRTFRSGVAPTRREAIEAAGAAHALGRPAGGAAQVIPA